MFGPKILRCIGSTNEGNEIQLLPCNTTNLNRQWWVWTEYEQLKHLKTGKCLHGSLKENFSSNPVSLEVCNSSLVEQKWFCHEDYMIASKTGLSALHLLTDNTVRMSPMEGNNHNKVIKIYSNMESVCSRKGNTRNDEHRFLFQIFLVLAPNLCQFRFQLLHLLLKGKCFGVRIMKHLFVT